MAGIRATSPQETEPGQTALAEPVETGISPRVAVEAQVDALLVQ